MKKILAVAVIVLGFVSSILLFIAGTQFSESGDRLTRLRSVGGTSVAEAYYQEIGQYGIAYSFFSYALGVGILATSIGVGGCLLKKEQK